jgi:putative acetyltransferase
VTSLEVHAGDPGAPDVRAVVELHLAFARSHTPRQYSHAVEPDDLSDPTVAVFCARADGWLVGIGALRELDLSHGEVKSMHTIEDAVGAG